MKNLLYQISELALKLKDIEFSKRQVDNQWLGEEATSEFGISEVENRLKVQFPSDYKEFLLISNGFAAPNDIEPTFLPIESVDVALPLLGHR